MGKDLTQMENYQKKLKHDLEVYIELGSIEVAMAISAKVKMDNYLKENALQEEIQKYVEKFKKHYNEFQRYNQLIIESKAKLDEFKNSSKVGN